MKRIPEAGAASSNRMEVERVAANASTRQPAMPARDRTVHCIVGRNVHSAEKEFGDQVGRPRPRRIVESAMPEVWMAASGAIVDDLPQSRGIPC